MKQQHTLQPKLRFPEFEGDWEKTKLGNIGEVKMCKRIFSEQTLPTGKIPFYKIGSFGKIADAFISRDLFEEYKRKFSYPQKGDILISASGTIGRTVIYNGEDAYFQDSNIIWLNINKDKIVNEFLYFVYQITKYNTEGGTIQRLYNNILLATLINIPSLPEQQKIADYLSTIDTKINLLEEKKAQLALYKKAMMQKLFAQEIRFKDNNGNDFPEWEEKRLGEVFSGLKGQGLSKDSLLDEGENNCILYGELFTKYKEVIKSVISKTNILSGVKSKSGDILIPASTTTKAFDLANATALLLDNVILGGDINILRPKQKLSSEFYAYYLSNYKKHELGKLGQGITIVHLYYTHFKNIMIDLPSLPEQQKIADFLSAIDASIEKVNEQITQTQSFKKAMLQQLFV